MLNWVKPFVHVSAKLVQDVGAVTFPFTLDVGAVTAVTVIDKMLFMVLFETIL